MTAMLRVLALVTAIAAPVLPMSAQAVREARFEIGGSHFVAKLPEGYCDLAELDSGLVAEFRKASPNEQVGIVLFRCDASPRSSQDFFVIKTPDAMLQIRMDRPRFLASLGAQFDRPGFAEWAKDERRDVDASRKVSKNWGYETNVDLQIGPLGRDEVCAYLGGRLNFSDAQGNSTLTSIVCTTTVGQRMIAVYRYLPGKNPEKLPAMLRDSKDVALGLSFTQQD